MVNKYINNVKHLLKKNKIKIGTFEKKIGVSTGYFSRKMNMSLDIALKIAEELNMSIEDIMNYDIQLEYKKERIKEIEEELDKYNDLMNELEILKNEVSDYQSIART